MSAFVSPEEAVSHLFWEAESKIGVQYKRADGVWVGAPLEWNVAKRFSDLTGLPVRIVGSEDVVFCSYPEEQERA